MITLTFAVGNIPILVLSPSYDNEPVYMAVARNKDLVFPIFSWLSYTQGEPFYWNPNSSKAYRSR